MKTKKLLNSFIGLFLVCSSSFVFGQSWNWGEGGYGSLKSNDYGSPVATDKNGNAYITGQYSTSVTFGAITLTGTGDNAYLAKYDSRGNIIWAVQPNDTSFNSTSYGISVTTDEAGNILMAGCFQGTLIFGNYTLTSGIVPTSAFLVKYDPNGNVLWATQSVNSLNYYYYYYGEIAYSVATDKNNNIFITGVFSDTTFFENDTLISHGAQSVFLVKYDPAGNVVWAKTPTMPSTFCIGQGNAVTIDNSGNAYITGYFSTAIFFGAYHLISLNTPSAFIAKYSNNGNLLWAKQSDNTNGITSMAHSNSATTDWGNNVYITGYFQDSIKFGSNILYSPVAYSNNTYSSAFLTKYDSNGNVLWVKQSSLGLDGTSLATDGLDHIYLGGTSSYNDTIYTMGGYTLHAIEWAYGNDFLLKFNTNGVAVCGSILENIGQQYYYGGVGIAADSSGTSGNFIYLAGTFSNDTLVCGPDTLASNAGSANIFLGRWLDCNADAGINNLASVVPSILIYPNPGNGMFTFHFLGTQNFVSGTIEVYNLLGEKVYSNHQITQSSDYQINLSSQPNGIYLYHVISETGTLIGEGKLVIEK